MTSAEFRRLRPCRWWLASKAIFILHFVVAVVCTAALWAMLAIFSMRLWQAVASGKAWSRRRGASCIYAYTLSIFQVRSPREPIFRSPTQINPNL